MVVAWCGDEINTVSDVPFNLYYTHYKRIPVIPDLIGTIKSPFKLVKTDRSRSYSVVNFASFNIEFWMNEWIRKLETFQIPPTSSKEMERFHNKN